MFDHIFLSGEKVVGGVQHFTTSTIYSQIVEAGPLGRGLGICLGRHAKQMKIPLRQKFLRVLFRTLHVYF